MLSFGYTLTNEIKEMALSNAQKQAAFRARNNKVGSERLQVVVNFQTKLALQRLSRHYDLTQSAMIERLLMSELSRVTHELNDDDFKKFTGESVTG
jgi:hypothetical protein